MPKISEYPEIKTLKRSTDYLVLEGADGTKKITPYYLIQSLMDSPVRNEGDAFDWGAMNPVNNPNLNHNGETLKINSRILTYDTADGKHKNLIAEDAIYSLYDLMPFQCKNTIWRGKYLGGIVTPKQYNSIRLGTFEDLFLGDYWEFAGRVYRIVSFDHWFGYGDQECTDHHVVLMLTDGYNDIFSMDDADTICNGYWNSKLRNTNMEDVKTLIKGDFGEAHILQYRDIFEDKCDEGHNHISSARWGDATIEIPNEIEIFGSKMMSPGTNNTYAANITPGYGQLAAFKIAGGQPYLIPGRGDIWLRDVVYYKYYDSLSQNRNITYHMQDAKLYIKPIFGLVG